MKTIPIHEPQRLRRDGDDYVVTIPDEVIGHYGLREDDLVRVELEIIESAPALSSDVARIADKIIERDIDALRYLGDH